MITKVSTVRNKNTGQIFEVVPGSLLPDFFEEVIPDIKVGEPKVEFEIEEVKEEPVEEKPQKVDKKKTNAKKNTKNLTKKKGAKKNGKTE